MIELSAALKVIHRQRRVAVVITTTSAAREWQQLAPHPKDLAYIPSSMGAKARRAAKNHSRIRAAFQNLHRISSGKIEGGMEPDTQPCLHARPIADRISICTRL